MAVLQEDIDEAERAVEVAELKLDQAERYHAEAGGEKSFQEFKVAQAEANAARDRVRRLRSTWAREHAAAARRVQAEKGFPRKRREALARQLADARDEAAHAVHGLDGAAREALEKVAEYAALVQQVSAELVVAGLRAGEGGEDGGTAGGVVHLGGEVWRPADAPSLLAAVARSAVAAQDPRHPVARWRQVAGPADRAAQDELLTRAVER